ncbi:hypothetical protein D3C85_742350 [compost metagenome]
MRVHRAILVAVVHAHPWAIDRQAQGVGADAVHLGIGIGEQPALEQAVFRGFDSRHEVGRCHGHLFGFLEEVTDVAVQDHLADLAFGNARPDFRRIQRVEGKARQLIRPQHLDVEVPFGKVAFVDGLDQVGSHVAVVGGLDLGNLLGVEVFLALQALPAELHVMHIAAVIDELVGMHAVAVHEAITGRCAFIGVQQCQGANGFGNVGQEVEAPGVVIQVGARVGLEGVDHVGELDRIADEEGREIVADQVPVAIGRVELGGETAWVAQSLRRVVAVHHRGEAHEDRRAYALLENLGAGQVADIGGGDEFAVDTGATCMHHALRDALAIEALELLDQLHILQQGRAVRAGSLGVLVVADGGAVVAGQGGGKRRRSAQQTGG